MFAENARFLTFSNVRQSCEAAPSHIIIVEKGEMYKEICMGSHVKQKPYETAGRREEKKFKIVVDRFSIMVYYHFIQILVNKWEI